MPSSYAKWGSSMSVSRVGVVGIGLACLAGFAAAGHFVTMDAGNQARARILVIWPQFDSMAASDKTTIARASLLCEPAHPGPTTRIETANCLLTGAQKADEEGRHGTDNLAKFKRLYRATATAANRHKSTLAQAVR
jgi:hypothetical protein